MFRTKLFEPIPLRINIDLTISAGAICMEDDDTHNQFPYHLTCVAHQQIHLGFGTPLRYLMMSQTATLQKQPWA
jgi:hypothetical protein